MATNAAAADNDYSHLFSPRWHPYFDRTQANLESHQLLWLDFRLSEAGGDDDDEQDMQMNSTITRFRQLVNFTRAFYDWRLCLEYIEKNSDAFTFFVCSPAYANVIVPRLFDYTQPNVWKVYIYCENHNSVNPDWLDKFDKVSEMILVIEEAAITFILENMFRTQRTRRSSRDHTERPARLFET